MSVNKDGVLKTENKAKVFATFFAWWRTDISKDLAYQYWRDVHAIWAARTPGFYQYRQLHLAHVDSTLLSDLEGVETNLSKEEQPNGMAHIAYSSTFIANLLRKPFALKQADKDDALFVSRNSYQRSILPLSRTYVDKINNPETNGSLQQPRYVLAFKKSKDVSEKEFRNYLTHHICQPWNNKEEVQRLRLEFMQAHINTAISPNGVHHSWDKDKQYQAWIELGITEHTQLLSMFDDINNLKKYISAIHAYPIREIYTIVFGGKPTLVGLRGYPAAKIIEELAADFQKSKPVLKFTYGSLVNGGKLLSQSFYVGLLSALIIMIMLVYFL